MSDGFKVMIIDGGFGTMIQEAGLPSGKDPTEWNIERPEAVASVHRAYVEAGAEIVLANTFGANSVKYHGDYGLDQLISAAVRCARNCMGNGNSRSFKVALDIGPTGKLLKPAGDLDFDAALAAFGEQVRFGVAAGVDCVFVETMSDICELKAAVLAAKLNCSLPVYATVALGEDGKLLTGGSVESVAALLESLGVEAYGFNCGLGPDRMLEYVKRLVKVSSRPVIVKPNAGMPRIVDGKTVFMVGPDDFASHVQRLLEAGATIVGGCCGTTPAHIRAIARLPRSEAVRAPLARTVVSSGVEAVELHSGDGLIIGERINPTGKRLLKEAYLRGDTAYVLREAVRQVEAGARILDVNCGVPGIDEALTLENTIAAVQSVITCPVQIDTADPIALERALHRVNGKALVNSVNGKHSSMDAVFPLVKRYGGTIVALCLDDSGIPPTVDGRLAIARRILAEGERYGFAKRDFVFDALTLAVSTDPKAALVTLETVRRLTDDLGVNTVLGVSNVSFGLPNRPALNNAMYTLAKRYGLSAAIANPSQIRECEDEAAFRVLRGEDENCAAWIAANGGGIASIARASAESGGANTLSDVAQAIAHGLRSDAAKTAAALLAGGTEPLKVIEQGIVPALERVGGGFERGSLYLPQLLMAADAAGDAFAEVRKCMSHGARRGIDRPIVLATVKGDIHDIGKNIVRALLENYGFDVIDLGRDVPPERIVEAARDANAFLVGLSALMTTTVGAMAETIRMIKAANLDCKVCVGGAVVTQEYANSIGADFYAKDAMRTVRIAESYGKM